MGGYVAGPPVLAALLRARSGGGDGAERRPGFYQPAHRPLGSPRPDQLPGNQRVLSARPDGIDRASRARRILRSCGRSRAGDVLRVLITGGSQGSRTLNEAARASWPLFREAGLAGSVHPSDRRADATKQLRAEFAKTGLAGEVVPFIGDMPAAFAQADLVVCRSGAGAVSELAAAGKPSVLFRFRSRPTSTRLQQCRGVRAGGRGAPDRSIAEWTGERFFEVVRDLCGIARSLRSDGRSGAKAGPTRRGAARGGNFGGSRAIAIDSTHNDRPKQ